MSNPYFKFKQFTIYQDRCTMKVCTDSCIFGAWTVKRLLNSTKILDIGSGTGLLSLMLAQKSSGVHEMIESDPGSAAQARENISESPWHERIRLMEGDVRTYSLPSDYDFIVTNPPFYESDLRSPDEKNNRAKHSESLTLDELISAIRGCLKINGRFSILLPFQRSEYFEKLAGNSGFFLLEKLSVRQSPGREPFRSVFLFGFQKPGSLISNEMIIQDERGKYSIDFTELLKDYYT
jgi:tRNA1Val (adenine37-N6)-methyltransferase